jgi:hypothetical protein
MSVVRKNEHDWSRVGCRASGPEWEIPNFRASVVKIRIRGPASQHINLVMRDCASADVSPAIMPYQWKRCALSLTNCCLRPI